MNDEWLVLLHVSNDIDTWLEVFDTQTAHLLLLRKDFRHSPWTKCTHTHTHTHARTHARTHKHTSETFWWTKAPVKGTQIQESELSGPENYLIN